jgi:phosphoribosylanthranilate isomerase
MFRVKICGITNVEDAIVAVEAGADAIGLNFYEGSPRLVGVDRAREICDAVSNRVLRVGVFVNASREEIERIMVTVGLDAIQLHGDEPAADVAYFSQLMRAPLSEAEGVLVREYAATADERRAEKFRRLMEHSKPTRVIRARRIDDRGVTAISEDLVDCSFHGGRPAAVLVDAATPGRYGGTGETVSWVGLVDHYRWLNGASLILAGGLRPENVAEAILLVKPHGVDVASGVESAPGKKDPAKVGDFVMAARTAF